MEGLLAGGGLIVIVVLIVGTVVAISGLIGMLVWGYVSKGRKSKAIFEASHTWVETSGRVIRSRTEVRGGRQTGALVYPRVTYEYEVDGRRYENDQIRAGYGWEDIDLEGDQAYKLVDEYPAGTEVKVFYDPQNPAQSALLARA